MMAWTDLVPWGRENRAIARQHTDDTNPFAALHREMNRTFDDFVRSFGFDMPVRSGMSTSWPNMEVSETDDEVRVVAELTGMDEKDIELSLANGVLTVRGERKSESNRPQYSERWHGQFQRSLHVGPDVDPEKVNASFNKGVLTVTLAKLPEAQSKVKHIPIGST